MQKKDNITDNARNLAKTGAEAAQAVQIGQAILAAKEGLTREKAIELCKQMHSNFLNASAKQRNATNAKVREWAQAPNCEGFIELSGTEVTAQFGVGNFKDNRVMIWGLLPKTSVGYELSPIR